MIQDMGIVAIERQ